MSSKSDQYARAAAGWSESAYADPGPYLRHRARLVASLGVPLHAGDEVLDLACGDGGLGEALLALGLRYRGVDLTAEMVAEARGRLDGRAEVDSGDLNDYVPPDAVDATTLFRAVYYALDRRAFFAHVASYTRAKLVFDLNPRQYALADVFGDLRATGWGEVALRPFFVPQTVSLPRPALALARGAERTGPLARLALRARFTYVVAAGRSGSD